MGVCGSRVLLLGHVFELLDLKSALGKLGRTLQPAAHCFEGIAQCRDLHVCALLHHRNCSLIDLESLGKVDLGQLPGFPCTILANHERGFRDNAVLKTRIGLKSTVKV